MPTAGQFCNRRVASARPGDTLREAAARMRDTHAGTVVVVDERHGMRVPIGILTDRDIVVSCLARTDRHIGATTVADVMSAEVITAAESDELVQVWRRMRTLGVRRMPVVDAAGALVGILSVDDLIEYLAGTDQLDELAHLIKRERSEEIRARH